MKKILLALVIVGMLGGCAVIPNRGTNTTYDATYDRSYSASVDALKEMGITVTESSKESGKIKGKKGDDTITVTVSKLGPKKTDIEYSASGGIVTPFNMSAAMNDNTETFFNKVQRKLSR